ESHRNDGAFFALELVFENGVARVDQLQFTGARKFGYGSIKVTSEAATRENAVELRDGFGGGAKRATHSLEASSKVAEDAQDLGSLVFGELHELVISFHGLERFEENGLAGGAGSVNDALDAAAMLGANGNDKTIVAKRDVVFEAA